MSKKNLEDTLPPTVHELVNQLQDMPNDKIGEWVVRFGYSLCGTRSYWNKSRTELTNMTNQQGTSTFFFTLSAADTKWPDLHALMPSKAPNDSESSLSMEGSQHHIKSSYYITIHAQ